MGSPRFLNPGVNCSMEDCNLVDFLPFNCDRCSQVFCLQHRSYTKHLCSLTNRTIPTVLICPLCAQPVRLHPNEDPNTTWDIHVNCDCDPSNYQNAAQPKRCPAPHCEEPLLFSTTIRCKDCAQEHCLRHRFAPDHNCAGPKKVPAGFIAVLRRSMSREFSPIRSPNSSAKWRLNLRNSASSIRASAEAGMKKLSNVTDLALQKAIGMARCRVAGDELMEKCLQCEARFSDVSVLIDHVEKVHEVFTVMVLDTCPMCCRTFDNPAMLVAHAKKDHGLL